MKALNRRLKRQIAKSTSSQIEKLLGQEVQPLTVPTKKMSKRQAKKVATTGRISPTQPIVKQVKLDTKLLVEQLKKQGRPVIEKKKPVVTAPRPILPEMPINKGRDTGEEDAAKKREEFRRFLFDMLGNANDKKYSPECIEKLEEAILYASDAQLDRILQDVFKGDTNQIREFYLFYKRNPKSVRGRNMKWEGRLDKAQRAKQRRQNIQTMDRILSIFGIKC